LALCLVCFGATTGWTQDRPASPAAAVQTSWRLLDYIAVDYPGAVQQGRIVSQLEYDEMREFSRDVAARLAALPPNPRRQGLVDAARELEAGIGRRDEPALIDRAARSLARRLLEAYPVPLAPSETPDPARGATLYAQHCVSCHGADGAARTPMAVGMDPPPIAFTDRARARERSLFALYQVISQGLEGTAMQSYAQLSEADRWAMALHAGRYAYPDSLAAEGERLWRSDEALRRQIPDLQALVSLTPAALAAAIGEDRAMPVTAFLRSRPDAIAAAGGSESLAIARDRMRQAVAAYASGQREAAADHALAAYLEGFEPIETLLAARNAGLVAEVEREMGHLRAAIARGVPAPEVEANAARLQALFDRAESEVRPEASDGTSTFLGAFAILLREGLEALLIVIAMITFLVRAERRELLRFVHGGWIAALGAGVATWWVATHVVAISGADRELTEGFGSLLAALILLFVGIWMHGKAQAGAWQAYVRDKLDRALSGGSAWLLFGIAFIAVYREVFETIIFYAALGGQGHQLELGAGIALAAALLAVIAWAMLRFSRRLPIAKFFQYSAVLIAILAVILAGKGVAALQEAGLIGVTPWESGPRSPMLGLYPTLESVGAQLLMALLILAGFLRARRMVVQPA
jgi:high-affinity iron transporter